MWHTEVVLIDWTNEFDAYLTRMEAAAEKGDDDRKRYNLLVAELAMLQRLTSAPVDDTPSLTRVRQSRRHQVWRLSHPYVEGIAMRLIVWFPSDDQVVVALFAADKAHMGDVFYNSVGTRADAAIATWLNQTENEGD